MSSFNSFTQYNSEKSEFDYRILEKFQMQTISFKYRLGMKQDLTPSRLTHLSLPSVCISFDVADSADHVYKYFLFSHGK